MRQQRADHVVFHFCIVCGNQLRTAEGLCSCCGYPTVETNRVKVPRHSHDRRLGQRDDDASEDPFYLP